MKKKIEAGENTKKEMKETEKNEIKKEENELRKDSVGIKVTNDLRLVQL